MEHKLTADDNDLDLLLLLDDHEGHNWDTNEDREANHVTCSDINEVCSIILAASICSSMPDLSSDCTPAQAIAPTQQQPKGSGKEKQEIKRLRDEVKSLQAELKAHKLSRAMSTQGMSFWEQITYSEHMEKQKSLAENEHLREAIEEHEGLIENMKSVLFKKPRRLNHRDIQEWQEYKLDANESLRARAIHAIADRQFSRMQSAFLRAGVLGQTEDMFRAQTLPQKNGTTLFELVNHTTVKAPFRAIGAAIWQIFGASKTPCLPNGMSEILETVDPCTVYGRVICTRGGSMHWQSNCIRKYYPRNDGYVFIGRAVLEDALNPTTSSDIVDDKWSWIQVVPIDHNRCQITLLLQAKLPMAADAVDFSRLQVFMGAPKHPFPHVQCAVDNARRVQKLLSLLLNDIVVENQRTTTC
ncbi:unnamed protein product [Aphanomyces euteiches]|uniref:START domain-containing protein n=1 Tax=Aphanomyces euteiches TaxID=100861 RepID=A0A6G0X7S3_9STRA|nr:hypothetical protein Ae201684_007678 [Aphanomyces euteiches]KAH9067115.1 hypothetical protein Ae201684P_021282 [Aphanomyces euteiches]KAH9143230.1 hypothetical protein AeRB84_012752 [Aphanomyces euteiches]